MPERATIPVEGLPPMPLVHPGFDPFIVATMPALYQLLPRSRHQPFVDPEAAGPYDLFDPDFWISRRWSMASPDSDDLLALQLPGVDSPERRREIALDHMAKCLQNAKTFHDALDRPARPPAPLELHLIAGDAQPTPALMSGSAGDRRIRVLRNGAGDGTVLRSSALMDERTEDDWRQHVHSPIHWSSVSFATSNHMALTRDRVVIDNVLYRLLEDPH